MGTSLGRPWDPVAGYSGDETFWGRPRDVGYTFFLNSSQKHIKLTLTSYSKFYTEF